MWLKLNFSSLSRNLSLSIFCYWAPPTAADFKFLLRHCREYKSQIELPPWTTAHAHELTYMTGKENEAIKNWIVDETKETRSERGNT